MMTDRDHLISIPVTNSSVNPARSTGPALFVGDWALARLWLFCVAPVVGGAIGRRRNLRLPLHRTLGQVVLARWLRAPKGGTPTSG